MQNFCSIRIHPPPPPNPPPTHPANRIKSRMKILGKLCPFQNALVHSKGQQQHTIWRQDENRWMVVRVLDMYFNSCRNGRCSWSESTSVSGLHNDFKHYGANVIVKRNPMKKAQANDRVDNETNQWLAIVR